MLNIIKKIGLALKRVFAKWASESELSYEDKVSYAPFAEKLEKLNIQNDNPAELSKIEIVDKITSHGSIFAEIGFNEGRRGLISNSLPAIAQNHADRWQSYLVNIFEGLKKAEEKHRDSVEQQLEDLKPIRASNAKHKKVIEDCYQWNYKSFSLFLGIFYLGVSFALMGSDFYLSLQLTAQGFEIPYDHTNFFSAINMQAIFLALGIAFCTVYIKNFYDEYFAFSIEKQVMQFRRKSIPWVENDLENPEKNRTTMRGVWYLRLVFKTIILFVIFGTLIGLGILRYETFAQSGKAIIITEGVQISGETDTTLLNKINNNTANTNQNNTANISSNQHISFILLTILFPLVGGICMSLGLDKIQNYRLRNKVNKEDETLLKKNLVLTNDFKNSIKELEKYNGILKWCGIKEFKTEYTQYFLSCYTHGFHDGILAAEIKDVFSHAEKLRNQHLMYRNFNLDTPKQ